MVEGGFGFAACEHARYLTHAIVTTDLMHTGVRGIPLRLLANHVLSGCPRRDLRQMCDDDDLLMLRKLRKTATKLHCRFASHTGIHLIEDERHPLTSFI